MRGYQYPPVSYSDVDRNEWFRLIIRKQDGMYCIDVGTDERRMLTPEQLPDELRNKLATVAAVSDSYDSWKNVTPLDMRNEGAWAAYHLPWISSLHLVGYDTTGWRISPVDFCIVVSPPVLEELCGKPINILDRVDFI